MEEGISALEISALVLGTIVLGGVITLLVLEQQKTAPRGPPGKDGAQGPEEVFLANKEYPLVLTAGGAFQATESSLLIEESPSVHTLSGSFPLILVEDTVADTPVSIGTLTSLQAPFTHWPVGCAWNMTRRSQGSLSVSPTGEVFCWTPIVWHNQDIVQAQFWMIPPA